MNETMECAAMCSTPMDAAKIRTTNCQDLFKLFVDETSGITAPQAGLLGCLVVSVTGLLGYGMHSFCDLVKSGRPVELAVGGMRFSANSTMSDEVNLPSVQLEHECKHAR